MMHSADEPVSSTEEMQRALKKAELKQKELQVRVESCS
jgi:hypothetical protein